MGGRRSQAQGCLEPKKLEEAGRTLHWSLWREHSTGIPWPQTSGLQDWERTGFFCSEPVCVLICHSCPRKLMQLVRSALLWSKASFPLGAAPCTYAICTKHEVHTEPQLCFGTLAFGGWGQTPPRDKPPAGCQVSSELPWGSGVTVRVLPFITGGRDTLDTLEGGGAWRVVSDWLRAPPTHAFPLRPEACLSCEHTSLEPPSKSPRWGGPADPPPSSMSSRQGTSLLLATPEVVLEPICKWFWGLQAEPLWLCSPHEHPEQTFCPAAWMPPSLHSVLSGMDQVVL